MQSQELLIIAGLLILMLVATTFLPQWQLRRAVRKLVRDFRSRGAISPEKAIDYESLGLGKSRSISQMLFKGRDWRGYAFQALLKAEMLKSDDSGRLYLVNDKIPPSLS
jgi:hypothetical protein